MKSAYKAVLLVCSIVTCVGVVLRWACAGGNSKNAAAGYYEQHG